MDAINFYVSRGQRSQDRLKLVYKLVEKALAQQMLVHIQCGSLHECDYLDNFLWSYQELSFIPHGKLRADGEAEIGFLVSLGVDVEPIKHSGLLINLSQNVPRYFPAYDKFAEVLNQTPEILDSGRKRYAYYRKTGYNLNYYQL
jgi:DNA polymerase-3 subunit chi